MSRRVRIRAVQPRGPVVEFLLTTDADLTRATSSGGWQISDRARRQAATEWVDYAPYTMTVGLTLDGIRDHPVHSPRSVERDIGVVEGWEKPADGQTDPPLLNLTGPVPHHGLDWVIQTVDWQAALRDANSGKRIQQTVSLTLLEHVPVSLTTSRKRSPAKDAQQRQSTSPDFTPATSRYTVRAGDDLVSISADQLGDYTRWPQVASMNGRRDPQAVTVGETIVLPSS